MEIMVDSKNVVLAYCEQNGDMGTTDESIKIIEVEFIPEDFFPNKYLYVNNEFIKNPEFKEPLPKEIRFEITRLKQELSDTDYLIIKYQEYILAGLEPPEEYDIKKIHEKRQALRDKINKLEDCEYTE